MKFFLFIGVFFIFSQNLQSKDLRYFEAVDSSTIKIYIDCSGYICPKQYSSFTRIATLNKYSFRFEGSCIDLSSNGDTIFKGNFSEGLLEGRATYFYDNGQIAEAGFYKKNKRDSTWNFFYKDGHLKKTAVYINGAAYFSEFFGKNGKSLISNGNGYYYDYVNVDNGSCRQYYIEGNLKNSQLDGKWVLQGFANETFKEGAFIQGEDRFTYKDNPRLDLGQLTGFYWQENVFLLKNYISCKRPAYGSTWLGGDTLKQDYISQFSDSVVTILSSVKKRNYWIMVQFDVDKEGNVLNVETYSQIEGIALNDLANSIKSFRWKFELKSENKYSKVYFPIIVKNRILSIPETQINYCNPNFNFIEEQIHKKVVRQ